MPKLLLVVLCIKAKYISIYILYKHLNIPMSAADDQDAFKLCIKLTTWSQEIPIFLKS